MTTLVTGLGWTLAGALAAMALLLRRRLELVAWAEHELRGPVTVLSLATERTGATLDGRAFEAELERLRAGLADLAAARRGRRAAEVVPAPFNLESFVRAAAAGWRPALRHSGRDIRVRWRGAAAIRADRGRVAKALGNVLANAVEHGEGPLEVRGGPRDGRMRIEVLNGGRGDRGRGLSIAAAAAEDMGGRLELRAEGDDTLAALELPADDAEADERPPAAA